MRGRFHLTGRLDYSHSDILLDLNSFQAWARTRSCQKEPETVTWLESEVRPGDVIYDIGANVGAYSLVACQVAENCTVFAFEPGFANFAALCTNVALNNLGERIIPLNVALSSETCLAPFQYSRLAAGAADHKLLDVGTEEKEPFETEFRQVVSVYRLDELIEKFSLPLPNLIKVDVDGPEIRVLRGAESTLGYPALRSILVEVDHTRDSSKEIFRHLERRGFRLHSRHRRGLSTGLANVIYTRGSRLAENDHAA